MEVCQTPDLDYFLDEQPVKVVPFQKTFEKSKMSHSAFSTLLGPLASPSPCLFRTGHMEAWIPSS